MLKFLLQQICAHKLICLKMSRADVWLIMNPIGWYFTLFLKVGSEDPNISIAGEVVKWRVLTSARLLNQNLHLTGFQICVYIKL